MPAGQLRPAGRRLPLPPAQHHISECPSKQQQRRDRGEWTLCGQFIDYDDPRAWEQPPPGAPWCEACVQLDG